jgi:hypothetical protein
MAVAFALTAVEAHAKAFFAGHPCASTGWLPGPTARLCPASRVLVFAPGPRCDCHVYASIGASHLRDGVHHEFLLCSAGPEPSLIEILAMVVYYHHTEGLADGHTFPIGRPWLPDASLDHFLVSRPYPFGPGLEDCWVEEHHVRLLWLLPIHASERRFRHAEGLEALETRFDAAGIDYLALDRPPVA